jgi:hypothetical protein
VSIVAVVWRTPDGSGGVDEKSARAVIYGVSVWHRYGITKKCVHDLEKCFPTSDQSLLRCESVEALSELISEFHR